MTNLKSPVRVAIIGAGNIAETSHMPAILAQGPSVQTVAVVDVDPERARDFAERWQISAAYRDLDKMLREAAPDLVIVCAPPVAHREAVVTCLRAGVWVWCEKPPTLSLAEYDEVAAHEAEGGPYVSYVFQQRFGSAARTVRGHISAGTLGTPLIGAVAREVEHRGRRPDYGPRHPPDGLDALVDGGVDRGARRDRHPGPPCGD